jgi:hypothetical protein
MARLFYEQAWTSDKVCSIEPAAWIPEYAWLYSIAAADGTFEASPRLIWLAAYAARPDWDIAKVAELLDAFARAGLLQRKQDEHGKVWGWWTGSKPFLPSKERIEKSRYRKGRGDLFDGSNAAAQCASAAAACNSDAAPCCPAAAAPQHCLGVGVGVGSGEGEGLGVGLDLAPKISEKEHSQEQSKPEGVGFSSLSSPPTPTPEPRLRKIVPRAEFESKKIEKEHTKIASTEQELIAELKATTIPTWTPEEIERMRPRTRNHP